MRLVAGVERETMDETMTAVGEDEPTTAWIVMMTTTVGMVPPVWNTQTIWAWTQWMVPLAQECRKGI